MARTFRRNRQMHPIAELNVTNLIDLGFTLLIIFMIATPLINQEQTISVKLPTEEKSPQTRPDPTQRTETITVDAKGNYFLNGRPVACESCKCSYARLRKRPNHRLSALRAMWW